MIDLDESSNEFVLILCPCFKEISSFSLPSLIDIPSKIILFNVLTVRLNKMFNLVLNLGFVLDFRTN